MSRFIETYQCFEACEDLSALWDALIQILETYHFSTVGYGCAYSKDVVQNAHRQQIPVFDDFKDRGGDKMKDYIDNYGFMKTSDPSFNIHYLASHYSVMDDPTILHCMKCEEPRLLHHRDEWEKDMTPTQKEAWDMFVSFGLAVGVNVPLRFEDNGIACFILCSSESEEAFDALWQTSKEPIIEVLTIFDQFTRENEQHHFYQLSPRKKEVLQQLAFDGNPKLVARSLGVEVTTVYDHLNGIREILHVQNDIQAIIKATRFQLIHI